MSSLKKRKLITDILTSIGNRKSKFFFIKGNWRQVASTLGGNIDASFRFCTPSHTLPVELYSSTFYLIFTHFFSKVPFSRGVNYHIKEKLLLRVETTIANSCSCKDFLSLRSLVKSPLVESRLVLVAADMDDRILGIMEKKCCCDGNGSSKTLITPKHLSRSNCSLCNLFSLLLIKKSEARVASLLERALRLHLLL